MSQQVNKMFFYCYYALPKRTDHRYEMKRAVEAKGWACDPLHGVSSIFENVE